MLVPKHIMPLPLDVFAWLGRPWEDMASLTALGGPSLEPRKGNVSRSACPNDRVVL